MDTKSKKFSDRLSVRVCAFILCIVLFVISLGAIYFGSRAIHSNNIIGDPLDLMYSSDYSQSDQLKMEFGWAITDVGTLMRYGSEERIRNGEFANYNNGDSDSTSNDPVYDFYENGSKFPYEIFEGDPILSDETMSKYYEMYDEDRSYYEKKQYDADVKKSLEADFKGEIDSYVKGILDQQIEVQLSAFKRAQNNLNNYDYYAEKGEAVISNLQGNIVPERISGMYDASFTYENMDSVFRAGEVRDDVINDEQLIDYFNQGFSDDLNEYENEYSYNDSISGLTLKLGMHNDVYKDKSAVFDEMRTMLIIVICISVPCFVLSLMLFIYLIVATGRKDSEGNIKLYKSDNLYTEIQCLIIGGMMALALTLFASLDAVTPFDTGSMKFADFGSVIMASFIFVISILAIAVAFWFFLALVRMLKAHIFIKRSLTVKLVKYLYGFIKTSFSKANPMGKFVIIILAACLLSMINVVAPVVMALVIGLGYIWIKKYTAVKKGVEEVSNGNLEYKIPVDNSSNSEFDQLARRINTISQASNIAIQNELKNQRLKTDLISNVSHDLKTPLTSIITYTDLLKKEGLTSPNAERYLEVIDEKGQRLKNLTEDLFEAAKASSGSIPVRFEKVDMLQLLKQGVVEKDEVLRDKGLEVIITAADDKYYVNADSQLLWRVVENLLSNIGKYALENSRVYIDLSKQILSNKMKEMVYLEIKNVSKAPLNIPEDELMERFKRGDESRTTEGSGLGLTIAKDLTKLQNGWFELKIDGDLFKATVILESYKEIIQTEGDDQNSYSDNVQGQCNDASQHQNLNNNSESNNNDQDSGQSSVNSNSSQPRPGYNNQNSGNNNYNRQNEAPNYKNFNNPDDKPKIKY